MHRYTAFALGLLGAAGLAAGHAQSSGATSSTETSPLAQISWFVGGTWVTDVKEADATTHVENHIRWAPNHQAIEFTTDFNGKPHYNGFYAYDPVKKSIGFYYTASDGEFTIGTAVPDPDGKTLHQDFDVMHPSGTTDHLRSTLVREGNDAYLFTVFGGKNDESAQLFQIRYQRKP